MARSTPLALLPAALAAGSFLASCTSYQPYYVGDSSYELLQARDPDGTVHTYEVRTEGTDGAQIVVTSERTTDRPHLGLTVVDLDAERARELGVRPYSGLLVTRVVEGAPAQEAGVRVGDLLTAANGEDVFYVRQMDGVLAKLSRRTPLSLSVQRQVPGAGADGGPGTTTTRALALSVTPEFAAANARTVREVELESAPGVDRPFAGFGLSTIPADLHEEMFGERREAVLIHHVSPGSPAYDAGLRQGDLVLTIDGEVPQGYDDVWRRIQEKGHAGETLRVAVARDRGRPYNAEVELADYTRRTEVRVPLVFGVDSGSRRSRWSLGPFGSVMAYRGEAVDSETRDAEYEGSFSMALGLFRHSWSPERNRTRLLWFITFDS